MSLEARLQVLQRQAMKLEPDAETRTVWTDQTVAYAQHFLEQNEEAPAYARTADNGRGLLDTPFSEAGIQPEEALALLAKHVDSIGLNTASARFMGYIPGGAVYPAALGDFLAAVSNRYSGYFFSAPGAVRMENMVLAWMAKQIGYPLEAAGNLTSGGSVAHLVGIVTARDQFEIGNHNASQMVAYFSRQTHHAVEKALHIAGLRHCLKRHIPVDSEYRMDADRLAAAIVEDKQAGLRPWLIIATAGTTNTGAIDPLLDIAQIARSHDLWLHIDGAYGAFFALCEAGRRLLRGMDRSDSIVMDPHKTLFLPYGSGAILVKHAAKLLDSFSAEAEYMQDGHGWLEELSPAFTSPELTKHFRGLRFWLPLQLYGVAPFRAALAEKLLLARYFHEKIQEHPGFKVGPEPQLAIATFWYEPQRGDANTFNQQMIEALQHNGRIFLTSTRLGKRFVIRVAVGSYNTHLSHIQETIAHVVKIAQQLEKDS